LLVKSSLAYPATRIEDLDPVDFSVVELALLQQREAVNLKGC